MTGRVLSFVAFVSLFGMAVPFVANAQYGGGGGPPVGIFGVSFGAPQAPLPGNAVGGTVGGSGQVLGASVYNFTRNFGLGASGTDVTQLQQFLTTAGFYSAPITGDFGSVTKEAVELFQKANNISPISGYVGPLTRSLLNQGYTPTASQEQSSVLLNLYNQLQQALKNLAKLSAST